MFGRTFVRVLVCCVLVVLAATAAQAAVKLPAVIGDNMVLQRGQPVPIWGWADKGEEVTVTLANRAGDLLPDQSTPRYLSDLDDIPVPKQSLTTKAGNDGRWKVTFDRLSVGKPLMMLVNGSSSKTILLKNILVGEVWVCSGQSNMEMGVAGCKDAAKEIAAAKYPQIRLFTVVMSRVNCDTIVWQGLQRGFGSRGVYGDVR